MFDPYLPCFAGIIAAVCRTACTGPGLFAFALFRLTLDETFLAHGATEVKKSRERGVVRVVRVINQ